MLSVDFVEKRMDAIAELKDLQLFTNAEDFLPATQMFRHRKGWKP
jgi:hypothetical protein